ncbi:hypothetical protein HPB48_018996 [Haemaphysalis longicornis]|uniref:Uncharacterized protein n=1 Tax=Haemaphysalis longicornis TaxID=44386 RepID=A0A9J6G9N7_HAELO|nr:hypothetical protein HPB48_018996 [Haemaphysalis longicornis]
MNPAFHQEHRLARAKALHTAHASHPTTLHVDAAEYPDCAACFAVVVNSRGDSVARVRSPGFTLKFVKKSLLPWTLQLPRPPQYCPTRRWLFGTLQRVVYPPHNTHPADSTESACTLPTPDMDTGPFVPSEVKSWLTR